MGQPTKFKRKQYLINKGFQMAYVGKILLIELIAVASTALLVSYMFLFVFNDDSLVSKGPWGQGILYSTIIMAVMLMIILVYLGILISHRIAGPMYRFQKTFEAVREGNINARVYLRDKDEMKPLATAFNAMLDVIGEQVSQQRTGEFHPEPIQEKLTTLISAVGLSEELSASDKDKYRKVLEGLMGKI